MSLFDHVKLLYDSRLYSNVSSIVNLMLSINDPTPNDLSNTPTKFQMMVYYADSLYHMKEYRKAENIYRKALQLKKILVKNKGKMQSVPNVDLTSDIDIKYQLHLCHTNLKQFSQAIGVLESIPGKQRTTCINMALAKLYQQTGMERSAMTCFKEVLKECPLALEAALGLLSLGVKGTEVLSLIMNATQNIPNLDWLSTWIKAHAHLHAREFTQATTIFCQLDATGCLRDNTDVLVSLGEAYHYSGEHRNAMAVLQKSHAIDPINLKGMDILAAIYAKEKKVKDLENLVTQLMPLSDQATEPWTVIAHLAFAAKKNSRAIYFAQKACTINPRNVEALLVKGNVLLEMKKLQEAVVHFREVLRIAPYRYEAHKGLVDSYIAMHRTRDAITFASNACKQLGQSPRALSLYAAVLAKDPLSIEKAKSLLEKALKQDPTYLNAVYQLAEIYEHEKSYEKGTELLRKQVTIQNTCRLHQMLGDFLARMNEHEKALDHYSTALNLDPNNSRALEGLQRVEQHSDALDNGYDIEVEDIGDSDNEGDLEESEVEPVWSDVDFP